MIIDELFRNFGYFNPLDPYFTEKIPGNMVGRSMAQDLQATKEAVEIFHNPLCGFFI